MRGEQGDDVPSPSKDEFRDKMEMIRGEMRLLAQGRVVTNLGNFAKCIWGMCLHCEDPLIRLNRAPK